MSNIQTKKEQRTRRHKRIRTKVRGTAVRPRLSFFKSNTAVYGQIVDDEKGMVLFGVSSKNEKGKTLNERARATGLALAKKAGAKKVTNVVFDRGGFLYIGNTRAFADGAREGGLVF